MEDSIKDYLVKALNKNLKITATPLEAKEKTMYDFTSSYFRTQEYLKSLLNVKNISLISVALFINDFKFPV